VGAGRPKGSYNAAKPARLTARVEQELADALERIAAQRGVKLSEVLREALLRFTGGRRKPRPRRKEKRRQC